MALYGLKYYWEKDRNGTIIRLEIQQKDYSGAAREIYEVQSLSLEMQGGQGNIDSAIVKTSLHIGVADAFDIADTDTMKYGEWTEFYTPDSTMYKVILYQSGSVRWTGFITPDSYEEDLSYGSIISLTARDNIGHMQDFPFDLKGDIEGFASVKEIITRGLSKAGVAMGIGFDTQLMAASPDGSSFVHIYDALINVKTFEDDDWYSAVDKVLSSLGLTLRYMDNNAIKIMSLRRMTEILKETNKAPIFVNNSGHRLLDPPYREIKETCEYKAEDPSYGELPNMTQYGLHDKFGNMDVARIDNAKNWSTSSLAKPLSLNPYDYKEGNGVEIKDTMFIALSINNDDKGELIYKKDINNGRFRFSFDIQSPVTISKGRLEVASFNPKKGEQATQPSYRYITYEAIYTLADGTRYTYDGSSNWTQDTQGERVYNIEDSSNSFTFSIECPLDLKQRGTFTFKIKNIKLSISPSIAFYSNIAYGRMTNIEVTTIDQFPKKKTVTTKYNDKYNVMLDRSPDIVEVGFNAPSPVYVQNGIYTRYAGTIHPLTSWAWKIKGTRYPLTAIIHQQLLCYHARPENVLTGELYDPSANDPRFTDRWVWSGRKLMLISGSLDLCTGRVNNAVLRGYVSYDDMWSEIPTIKLLQTSVNVPAAGGIITLDLLANVPWRAQGTMAGKLLQLNPSAGESNDTISVTVPANTVVAERRGTVTVDTRELGQLPQVSCSLIQAAAEAQLSVSPQAITLDQYGNSERVAITCNTEWTANSSADWIRLTKLSAHELQIQGPENSGYNSVTKTSNVVVTASDKEAIINVTQEAAGLQANIVGEATPEVPAAGGIVSIIIATNAYQYAYQAFGAGLGKQVIYLYDVQTGSKTKLAEVAAGPVGKASGIIPNNPGKDKMYTILIEVDCLENTSADNHNKSVTLTAENEDKSNSVRAHVTVVQPGPNI